jgi:hypothetical protein
MVKSITYCWAAAGAATAAAAAAAAPRIHAFIDDNPLDHSTDARCVGTGRGCGEGAIAFTIRLPTYLFNEPQNSVSGQSGGWWKAIRWGRKRGLFHFLHFVGFAANLPNLRSDGGNAAIAASAAETLQLRRTHAYSPALARGEKDGVVC